MFDSKNLCQNCYHESSEHSDTWGCVTDEIDCNCSGYLATNLFRHSDGQVANFRENE